MEIGKPLPNLILPTTFQGDLHLADFKNKKLILFFYPKDCTSGCTREAQDFRDHYSQFQQFNTVIFGISKDNINAHKKFISKENLPFDLIADTEKKLCEYFQVIKSKNMYGKTVLGIERSTFLIDEQGILRKEWRKVKVAGHVAEVLGVVKTLN
ncbi:MAG: Putative peroxiredoxin bcp [Legionellaceae bacterium]